jgi:hypothetical protein
MQYLAVFPEGAHIEEARQRVQTADDKAWASALGAGTILALNQYAEQLPGGAHIAQDQSIIATLERQATDQKPSAETGRFDGAWQSTISCTAAGGAQGYTYQFAAQVKDGCSYPRDEAFCRKRSEA